VAEPLQFTAHLRCIYGIIPVVSDVEPTSKLRLTTTEELLRAVELGIVDRTEARSLLGLGVKRGRFAKIQPRAAGRFSKSEQVLPFNRFSGPSKQAMVLAQEAAQTEGRANIQTLDMLLALAQDRASVGGRALAALGVDEDKIRAAAQTARATAETTVEGIGPTAELKQVVERAFKAVEYSGDIGTEHLLLALATGDGVAGSVLRDLGLTEQAIRTAIRA
jgi:Clp amino terminal domain, pathogenicity island component